MITKVISLRVKPTGLPIATRSVEAVPIRIKGFEHLELFCYQSDGYVELEAVKRTKGLFIVSAPTGDVVAYAKNPEEAYSNAQKGLNQVGQERVNNLVEKRIASLKCDTPAVWEAVKENFGANGEAEMKNEAHT